MKSILSYCKSRSNITILLIVIFLSGLFIIISQPRPLQIYNTYMQQLTSSHNSKTLSADQIAELNRKFNLMDVSEKSYFSMLLGASANSTDECTVENIVQKKMQQDHPCVIDYIRKNYLKKPPPPGTPLNIGAIDTAKVSHGQADIAIGLLKHKKNGFFVDCGANDGLFLSNTLHMEAKYNWTGLLIEANPVVYKRLEARNRNAYLSPLCLSMEPFATNVTFLKAINDGHGFIEGVKTKGISPLDRKITMQCFPLYSILLAVGRVDVDFFSLDIEGHELALLKTIPFHKTNIKSLVVEFMNIPEGLPGLNDFMEKSGYFKPTNSGEDAFFMKDCTDN